MINFRLRIFTQSETMDKTETEYILKNYYALMSKPAASRLKKFMDVFNVKVVAKGQEENREVLDKLLGVYALTREDMEMFTEEAYALFLSETATEIAQLHPETVRYNKCPVCGQLATTPIARQGNCGHTW
jgi:hypothetical protein